MTIEIKETLTGSILDIGGGGEAVIGQIYKDRVTAIDNCEEELEEAPDCCCKQLMDATELLFPDDSFDNVTFFYTLMYMSRNRFVRLHVFSEQANGCISGIVTFALPIRNLL